LLTAIRDATNPMTPRIQMHLEKLDANRKRALAQPPAAEYSGAKRQRVDESVPQVQVRPLAPGPQSLAAIFTLTNNPGLQAFDASQVSAPLAARININALATINQEAFLLALQVSSCRTTDKNHN